MGITLAQNEYCESGIRVLRVTRHNGFHEVKDLTLSVSFQGDFESAHTVGDNRKILPADTMKNTVFVLAKEYPAEAIEDFVLHLAEHFLTYNPQVSKLEITAGERPWSRIVVGEKPHSSAFVAGVNENRSTHLTATRQRTILQSGIENLVVLKTTNSSFKDFLRDPYTTLEATGDRLLSAAIRASWTYADTDVSYSPIWQGVRKTLLENFATHESHSLQHTLFAMGHAVLDNFDSIRDISLSLTSRQCWLVDLKPFGMKNDHEVFSPADEPHELVEATLRREP